MNRFWIVVKQVSGNKSFSKQHDSLESAKEEASRLAIQTKESFMVLELVGTVGPIQPQIVWEDAK